MTEAKKNHDFSLDPENPRRWLTAYLHRRARLAAYKSDFHCHPACTRPGCSNNDLQIQISLIDLWGAALHLQESVSTHYHRHCSLGLFSNERNDWLRMVALKLNKPCPFLSHHLCVIYPVRPLPCILFPEYLVTHGDLTAIAVQDPFRDYLCLKHPILLTPGRAKVLATLMKMWRRETILSNFYLFAHAYCYLDFSNLTHQLSVIPKESANNTHLIPHQALEHFFSAHIAGHPLFVDISEKIRQLDSSEGQWRFFHLFHDDLLLKKLIQSGEHSNLAFRFSKGKLKKTHRSLLPPEYKFL